MRFSLKWMLAALAFVGFGCVALYNADIWWAAATFGVTVMLLLVVILGAIYLRPRAFYIGICVFGWGYLILAYVPLKQDRPNAVRPLGAADLLLVRLIGPMRREIPIPYEEQLRIQGSGNFRPTAHRLPVSVHFHTVGHSLFALIFGVIGGAVGQCFARGAK